MYRLNLDQSTTKIKEVIRINSKMTRYRTIAPEKGTINPIIK